MSNLERERLWFLRGLLAACASSGQVVTRDEVRRLCGFRHEEVSTYLEAARRGQQEDEPDFCAVVGDEPAATASWPGEAWPSKLRDAHQYWRDRRSMEDAYFEKRWLALPTFPPASGGPKS